MTMTAVVVVTAAAAAAAMRPNYIGTENCNNVITEQKCNQSEKRAQIVNVTTQ